MSQQRHGRARFAVATATAPVRCAIYCRKSTTEGLDSNFSGIDNQREAAEAFIASQRHEGWAALADHYDDGGFSGGNVERPALKKLMADVDADLIDTIVVYKLDRLSRSLVDFGRIHEFLEKRGVALVSVTESINTKSPHGRMMVNVLLSFAQYERELIGERTRDKLHAARRKGKFVGGYPVLGYDHDPVGSRLVVNEAEAERVREIFRLFLDQRSILGVVGELNRRGWTLKRWTTKDGKVYGGGAFSRVTLRRMLRNQTYVGKVDFDGQVYDGEHEGVVPRKLFHDVQRTLGDKRRDGGAESRNSSGALLRGLLRCVACDAPMIHTFTKRRSLVFRYYRCAAAIRRGAAACPSKPVKADKIESYIVEQIRRIGADPELQKQTFQAAIAQLAAQRRGAKAEVKRLERATPRDDARLAELRAQLAALAAQRVDEADVARALAAFEPIWDVLLTPERERVLRLLVERVSYDGAAGKLEIAWRLAGFGDLAREVDGA
jgi:site-specific DNA recombinase